MAMRTHWKDGIVVLEPSGKIIGAAIPELRDIMFKYINTTYTPRVLINLEKVNRMDSSGLGLLVRVHAAIQQRDGHIGVINVGKHIKNLIIQSRLLRLFEHFDTEAAAISALSSRQNDTVEKAKDF